MIIYLNVGGILYVTSKDTLEKYNNYFSAIMRNKEYNSEESIFIDRDPCLFRYILNWLRGVTVLPEDALTLRELLYEADYYSMEDMTTAIKTKLDTSTTLQTEISKISKLMQLS
tara:strand:- start:54 stop:395 length:342 start_codon:yes stop_codon:yes gene_type:complete